MVYSSLRETHLKATQRRLPYVCHPAQVNAPRFNPSKASQYAYSIYLPQRDERLSWPPWCCLHTPTETEWWQPRTLSKILLVFYVCRRYRQQHLRSSLSSPGLLLLLLLQTSLRIVYKVANISNWCCQVSLVCPMTWQYTLLHVKNLIFN